MAQKATITVTDHASSSPAADCTQYYVGRYKINGENGWTTVQFTGDEWVIENLEDNTTYDIEITRVCCSGATSLTTSDQFTTGETSPA